MMTAKRSTRACATAGRVTHASSTAPAHSWKRARCARRSVRIAFSWALRVVCGCTRDLLERERVDSTMRQRRQPAGRLQRGEQGRERLGLLAEQAVNLLAARDRVELDAEVERDVVAGGHALGLGSERKERGRTSRVAIEQREVHRAVAAVREAHAITGGHRAAVA